MFWDLRFSRRQIRRWLSLPWIWMEQAPLKRRWITGLHCAASRKTVIFKSDRFTPPHTVSVRSVLILSSFWHHLVGLSNGLFSLYVATKMISHFSYVCYRTSHHSSFLGQNWLSRIIWRYFSVFPVFIFPFLHDYRLSTFRLLVCD
jgi:hypothetical protein